METSRTSTAALGGLGFAVISVVGGALLPKPPAPIADAPALRDYFGGHHGALVAGSLCTAIAAVALIPFLASVRSRLLNQRVLADSALAAGAALVAVGLLGALLQAAVAHMSSKLDDSSLLAAYGLERAVFYVAPPFFVVALAGAVAL